MVSGCLTLMLFVTRTLVVLVTLVTRSRIPIFNELFVVLMQFLPGAEHFGNSEARCPDQFCRYNAIQSPIPEDEVPEEGSLTQSGAPLVH